MNSTASPIMKMATDVTSVTYSYSPGLSDCIDALAAPRPHDSRLSVNEESLFSRQGDYWIIGYQGQLAFLKATRGLQCLSVLLRHPGREFHVSELVGLMIGQQPLAAKPHGEPALCHSPARDDAVLDARAKAEYKLRLENLRADLHEAERFCDAGRAERARSEIAALTQQLALAIGLGGRDRRSSSEAERARSTVTKRIKDAICRIGEAIPALRHHLASQIRTGYFCSYNLSHEHPVAWTFL